MFSIMNGLLCPGWCHLDGDLLSNLGVYSSRQVEDETLREQKGYGHSLGVICSKQYFHNSSGEVNNDDPQSIKSGVNKDIECEEKAVEFSQDCDWSLCGKMILATNTPLRQSQ